MKSRYAVVVLGMHRSGTSALAGVMGHLGCDLPKMLMPANEANPKGYFESLRVYNLNDAILASAGSSWDDWQEFNPGWIKSPRVEEFIRQGQEVLSHEFETSSLFVLKDPRMCRLVPFWLKLFERAEIKPFMVVTHRNPLEVAKSLERREKWPFAYGLLLWLRHVLDCEGETRGVDRYFTSYDRMLKNWAGVAAAMQKRLDLSFPRFSDSVSAEIDAFLSGKLRTHSETRDAVAANPLVSKWIRTTFEILERWAEDGELPSDYATLDIVRAEFNAATPMFGKLVQIARSSSIEVASLSVQNTEQSAALQATQARNAEIAQALDVTTKQARETQHALEAARDETGGLRAELLAEKATRTAAEQRIDQLQTEMTAKMTALDSSHERNEVTVQALSAARSDTTTLRLALVSQQGFLDALLSERNTLDERNADLAARLDAQEAALLESRMALARLQHEKDQISSALIQRSHEAEDVGREYAESRQKLKEQAATITALGADRDTLAAEQQQTNKSIRLMRVRMEEQLRKEVAEALTVSRNTMDKQFTTLNEEKHALKATILELNTAARHGAAERDRLVTATKAEKVRAVEQEKRLTAQIAQQKSAVAALEADLQALRSQAQQTKTEHDQLAKMEAQIQERVVQLMAQNDAMLGSTSWRVTAPLRRLVTIFR